MLKKSIGAIQLSHISLAFVSLMFCLPFITMHHEQPIPSFYPEWLAAAFGLIATIPLLSSAAWRSGQSTAEQSIIQIPQSSLMFIGLAAILSLQWAIGMLHSNKYAFSMLLYVVWGFLLTVIGSHLRRKFGWEKLVSTLAWSLVVAGIINICIVVLQFVMRTGGNIPFLPDLSGYGAISQTNHFANFSALATASLIYLYAKGRFSYSFFNLLLVLFIVMLALSGSRSVWLYLTAFTVLIIMMRINITKQGKETDRLRGAWRAGIMLLPAFILIQLFMYYFVPNELISLPTERLIDGVTERTSSIRLQFWQDSLRIFLQNPWLGVGVDNFRATTFLLVDSPTAFTSKFVFEHAHNLFLHLLAEMGFGAFLVVLIGLLAWVSAFKWRNLDLETCWLISLLSVLGIHSMVEYPLWFAFFLGVTAILLGAGDEKLINFNFSKYLSKFIRPSLLLVLMLGVTNLSTMLMANIKLENWLHKLAYQNINERAPLDWARQYSSLEPYAEALSAMTMGDIKKHDLDKQILLHQSVINFRPESILTYQLALLLELQGKHESAVKQFNKAITAYPANFNIVLQNTTVESKKIYLVLYAEVQKSFKNHAH